MKKKENKKRKNKIKKEKRRKEKRRKWKRKCILKSGRIFRKKESSNLRIEFLGRNKNKITEDSN